MVVTYIFCTFAAIYDLDSNTAFFTFITTTIIINQANRALTICTPAPKNE